MMNTFQNNIGHYLRIPLIALILAGSQPVFSTGTNPLGMSEKELELDLKYALLSKPKTLTAFRLNDQNDKPFSLKTLKGEWTFMYFGYTSCPDICPTTIDELSIVSKKLAEDHRYEKDTQYVFVSVDPYRDTPKVLKKFTAYFGFNLLGVVAPVKKLNKLANQLGVTSRRLIVEDRDTKQKEYDVEHSSYIYLIDPQGKEVAKFSPPHYGKEIKQVYVKIREQEEAKSAGA
jgi:protein SCO1/2